MIDIENKVDVPDTELEEVSPEMVNKNVMKIREIRKEYGKKMKKSVAIEGWWCMYCHICTMSANQRCWPNFVYMLRCFYSILHTCRYKLNQS